jgi:hypothetical protein
MTRTLRSQPSRLISLADRHKSKQIAKLAGVWSGRIALSISMLSCFGLVTNSKIMGIPRSLDFLVMPMGYLIALSTIILLGIAIGGWWGKTIALNLAQSLRQPLRQITTFIRLREAIAAGAIVVLVGGAITTFIFYGIALLSVIAAYVGITPGIWLLAIVLLCTCPGFIPAIVITRMAIIRAVHTALPELNQ